MFLFSKFIQLNAISVRDLVLYQLCTRESEHGNVVGCSYTCVCVCLQKSTICFVNTHTHYSVDLAN